MKTKFSIYSFAFLPDYDAQIENLLNLARSERWDYVHDSSPFKHPVLRNYINHTFLRLFSLHQSEPSAGYIYESPSKFCFDTGLFTKNFEPIYALFSPNKPGRAKKWALDGFFKKSAYEMQKVPILPRRATYFDSIEDLIYDTRIDLRINIDHILDDQRNKERIPDTYRNLPSLPMLFLGTALEYAKIRIQENYKAAVPQYFHGRIQFLIPISLGDPSVVDLSLAVGKSGGIYTGHTCLTLDMAYNNARLIAKPESDWLVTY